MTWFECERFVLFYNNVENVRRELFVKELTIRNIECLMVSKGKPHDIKRYIDKLISNKEAKENNIDDQFQGVDFG